MAFRRSRHSWVKAVLAIPVLYFSVVGLLVTISGRGIPDMTKNDETGSYLQKRENPLPVHDKNDPIDEQFHNKDDMAQHQWGANTLRPPVKHEDPLIPPFDSHVEDEHIQKLLQENDAKRRELRQQREEMEGQKVIQKPGDGLGEGGENPAPGGGDPNALFVPTKPPDYDPKRAGMGFNLFFVKKT